MAEHPRAPGAMADEAMTSWGKRLRVIVGASNVVRLATA
jgi:hypothetical protein